MIKVKQRKGPFWLVSSRQIYKNPWISVREDKVIRPNGKRGIFGIVEAQPGSSVVPVDEYGYCYLIKEYHYGVNKITIELVSGGMDKGESPLRAAKRELLEEAGLKSDRWVYLGTFYPFTTILYSPQYVFLAIGVKKIAIPLEEDRKLIKIIRIPFRKAVKMVLGNKINHAGSTIAILKADYYLRSNRYALKKSRN